MPVPELIDIPPSDSPDSAGKRFPHAVDAIIFLFGSLDPAVAAEVRSAFVRGLLPIAQFANALIVDNGGSGGLPALLGHAAQELDQVPARLGILPSGVAGPDPSHDVVMRLPAEWTDPAKAIFLVTASLAQDKSPDTKPVIALLVGGSDAERTTVLRCVRSCWPLLIMKGTGGLGDAILSAAASVAAGEPLERIADPDMREIVEMAAMTAVPLQGDTNTLKRLLLGPIQKPGEILADAWARYDDLDLAAVDRQKQFRSNQLAILVLTVVATFMAVLVTLFKDDDSLFVPWTHVPVGKALHYVLLTLPILLSLQVGFNARFREGNKWILLRSAAESIKQHLFRYRTRSGIYGTTNQSTAGSAPSLLAANIQDITSNLMQSEVNRSSLKQRNVQDPTRTTFLSAEEYLRVRVEDQIGYFVFKTQKLHRQMKRLQLCILVAGGVGTLLAAIHQDVWVALTTALATAVASKLELDQVESSLVQYNTALMSLRNLQSWWKGLSPWEKSRRKNIDLLVDQTETVLSHETSGWVQKMQSTLEKLTQKESSADEGGHRADQKRQP